MSVRASYVNGPAGTITSVTLPAPFLRQAITQPLSDRGFARQGRRNVWLRDRGDIGHAVSLENSHGSWKVRWDVVQPAVGAILHGKRASPADVSFSGIVTGTAQAALGAGITASFTLNDLATLGTVVDGVRNAVLQVAGFLDGFARATDVVAYLTADVGQRDSRVIFPAHRPIRLFTAAAIAAVLARPDAQELATGARDALGSRTDRTTRERLERLAAVLP